MILLDSSVWVAIQHGRLSLLDLVAENEEIACCPVVITEVMRGVRLEQYESTRKMLAKATLIDAPTPLERFEEAARIYLRCRVAGITPSTPDSLIAACAIAKDIPLLHDDSDFDHMANVVPLKTLTRS
ncbi:MAG TPA: PIN domain-containing protein [Thermoanaerobaculia bacterium]